MSFKYVIALSQTIIKVVVFFFKRVQITVHLRMKVGLDFVGNYMKQNEIRRRLQLIFILIRYK